MDILKICANVHAEACAAWNNANYDKAREKYTNLKSILTNYSLEQSDKSESRKINKIFNDIEEELTQMKKEEQKRLCLINALSKCHTPEAPPADPAVWAPLPPKMPMKKKSTPVQRRGEPRTTYGNKTPTEKDRRIIKQGGSADETMDSTIADSNNLLDKWSVTGEYDRALVSMVLSMMKESSRVEWEEILGLEQAKEAFRQVVILPALVPEFFKGIRRPATSVLLFGPPGSGKTLLAKAVATASNSTFFLVQTADIASKWRGDSEKLVKLLFAMAREQSPSIIFFDEIDAIASQRGSDNEHEASRRVKSQLLVEMDGFNKGETEKILVLAATNFPWNLDEALRRRFEKRILIGLPEQSARRALLDNMFQGCPLDENVDLDIVAGELEGYSPADITIVCRKAAAAGITRLTKGMSFADIQALKDKDIHIPVTCEDIREAVGTIKSSVDATSIARYGEWFDTFGSS